MELTTTTDIRLSTFLDEFGDTLKSQLLESMEPVYQPGNEDEWDRNARTELTRLIRKPFPAQTERGILPIAKAFYKHKQRAAFLVGEMGTGKTLMGLAIAGLYPKPNKRILIQCPGHLVQKWKRETEKTLPGCRCFNLNNKELGLLLDFKNNPKKPVGTEIYIIGKERAKLHYQKTSGWSVDRFGNPQCPQCGEKLEPSNPKKKPRCPRCNTPIWQADRNKTHRFAKAEFIKRYLPYKFFDVLLLDECHELKGGLTAQGQAMHCLISSSKKVLALTGTLMGGYSKDLFFLLWRMFPSQMKELGIPYGKTQAFAERFGVLEHIYRNRDDGSYNTASIGGSKNRVCVKEAPGVSPLLLSDLLLSRSAFIRLNDVASALPKYDEIVVSVDMNSEQNEAYSVLEDDLLSECRSALARGDHRLLGKMVQSLLAYPDTCRRSEIITLEKRVVNNEGQWETEEQIIAHAPALDIDLLPKEEKLLEILEVEKALGRRVAVFLEHTGTRDLIPTLVEKIEAIGLNPLILRSTAVKPEKREMWLKEQLQEGDYNCLVCNPRLVCTGLDLLEFPTIIFFQSGYSVFTLRQASRRSWRIGQSHPVRVFYLGYSATMQSRALSLMAQKMETSLAVEGELTDKGLSALSESENSIVIEMARALAGEEKTDSVEDAWSAYKQREVKSVLALDAPDPEVSSTTTIRTATTISTPDTETSITHERIIVRARIYQKPSCAVAVVDGNKFNLSKGSVRWKDRIVGQYDRKGKGSINGKPIKIFKPKDRSYFVLAEIRKEVLQKAA
jgi:SNF2 family DNA or RNA helicase